ncbi:MAG: HEAT repeat domain-containing protein [bacterium]
MKLMLITVSLAATMAAQVVTTLRAEHAFATTPPTAWSDADPADSLYRAARRALTDKDYEASARLFDAIVARFPRSEYASDALYWKGFALYRNGSLDDAQDALEAQAKRYPKAATRGDASALLIQVKGQLAQRGDASARQDVTRAAAQSGKSCDDMEVQMAALDAMQQMDADRVLPLLKRVLARRDECSKPLRKNALFILAQKSGSEREKILLDVAKSDPDVNVRTDAVFHLQQAKTGAAIEALEDLLLHSDDRGVRQNALFALAQNKSDRARKIIKTFALSDNVPVALRKDAVFHIAQGHSADDAAWLREAYAKVSDSQLRSDIMFQIASMPSAETSRWLASVINDQKETAEQRKNALFFLAQQKNEGLAELIAVYDRTDATIRKEIIFYIAQRHDDASLAKLIAIAKSDPNPQLRKEALFHIGQSKDPKALKALEEIVNP